MATTMVLRHLPGAPTLFKNIFKVEPGQIVEIDLGGKPAVSKSYFADVPRLKRTGQDTRKRLVAEYGQLLEKAVERQMLSDVEVGVFLSGGVDSSLVAAIARSKVKSLKAFTVGLRINCLMKGKVQ